MFRRLRLQFITIASVAVMFVLLSVVGILNSVRYFQTQQNIQSVLTILSNNKGTFPSLQEAKKELSDSLTLDSLVQYRYFSVVLDRTGEVNSYDSDHISALSDEEILLFAQQISGEKQVAGSFKTDDQTYYYRLTDQGKGQSLLVALDVTSQLDYDQALVNLSIFLSLGSFTFFVMIISVFSGKVIEPFVRNYERQRRFITNAGHELKTPLAIIGANNELVEMMKGESEWTKSTADQVTRLTGLINGLVALARLEEQPELVLSEVDFSAITQDAAEDFKGPVIRDGKTFTMAIQEGIKVKAEEKSLFELVTLLVDNANKYCDPKGQVSIKLTRANRLARARLEIANTYAAGKDVDYSRFFERFYRQEESHNNDQQSGYGIGLSMAQSMVRLFKGQISVSYKGDNIRFIVLL